MEIQTGNFALELERKRILHLQDAGLLRLGATGFCRGREIYLASFPELWSLIGGYLHEVGHYLGENYSYQVGHNPGEEPEVLSFRQTKRITIDLTLSEKQYLQRHLEKSRRVTVGPTSASVVNKLLAAFTRGKFDPESVNIHPVSRKILDEMIRDSTTSTTVTDAGGKMIPIESEKGIAVEVSACYPELCCLQILENTLHRYHMLGTGAHLLLKANPSDPHQRAMDIVAQCLNEPDFRPLSMKDFRAREVSG